MKRSLWRVLLWLAAIVGAAAGSRAQQLNGPHAGYAFPAGGRQGTTVEVTVGGQQLGATTGVYFSGDGVQATVGAYHRPMTNREAMDLRDRLQEARKKLQDEGVGVGLGGLRRGNGDLAGLARLARLAGITEDQLRDLQAFQRSRTDPKKQLNPQIAETIKLEIAIASSATPGPRELRLITPAGLSNPVRFEVGQVREYVEAEPNDVIPDAGTGNALPVVINGQILPGDVDRFSFAARKGMNLVIAVEARELVPYLADAVPGWFQAAISLYDPKGNEIAYADHNSFHPDPLVHCLIPENGTYIVEIRDSIYRGREDFVYRMSLGELPYITSIFPLGGRDKGPATVSLTGWNLPKSRLALDNSSKLPGTYAVFESRGGVVSNLAPFAVDTLPEVFAKEPSGDPAHAQRITLPVIVNGRIARPGDENVFRFDGRAGRKIVVEVIARRLGSPVDSLVTLTDQHGKQIAENDDFEDKEAGLLTHQADSYLAATLPTSGPFYVRIRDAQHKGGPEYGYRLRISEPRPSFDLCVTPSNINARAGSAMPLTVYALRRDGFVGDIALELKDAPEGFVLSGARIPASADHIRLTLTVPPLRTNGPVKLRMEGLANVAGREVHQVARAVEDMMQAFAYHHLVSADAWTVNVSGRGIGTGSARLLDATPVKVPAGGSVRVRLAAQHGPQANQIQFALSDPPDGIDIQNASTDAEGFAFTLRADAKKVKPGTQGNLIVDAYRSVTVQPLKAKRAPVERRQALGTLPAIPFQVVAP